MTDKEQVLAYLAEVQRMQMEAYKIEITIESCTGRDDCWFRVVLQRAYDRYVFCFWSEYSERENQREMERLRKVYNSLKPQTNDNNNNSNNNS